jgi:tRNA(Ile)-lysidine synthase TilS/MesJ
MPTDPITEDEIAAWAQYHPSTWHRDECGGADCYVRRLLAERRELLAERDGLRGALTECERVLDDCRRAFDIRADANIVADAAADVRHVLTQIRAVLLSPPLTAARVPGATKTRRIR